MMRRAWLLFGLLAGCGYVPPGMVAEPASMAASAFAADSVKVAPVSGVQNNLWQVMNGDVMVIRTQFHDALLQSLAQSGMFATVRNDGAARYVLQAEIERQEKQASGVVLRVRYTLTETADGRVAWQDEIQSAAMLEPGLGAAMFGRASLSAAAFRAAGSNIVLMLARLSGSQD